MFSDDEEEEVLEVYTISELMEESQISRQGVTNFLKRKGLKPVGLDGQKNLYDGHVLYELLNRKTYQNPQTSKTSGTSKTSQESEERIAHLEAEINLLRSQMSKIVGRINHISDGQKLGEMFVFLQT